MAEELANKEDSHYELEAAAETFEEIHGDETEQQASPPVYSQVMEKKLDPSCNAQSRSHNTPARIHAECVRTEVVYAKPQKAITKTANAQPGTTFSPYLYFV